MRKPKVVNMHKKQILIFTAYLANGEVAILEGTSFKEAWHAMFPEIPWDLSLGWYDTGTTNTHYWDARAEKWVRNSEPDVSNTHFERIDEILNESHEAKQINLEQIAAIRLEFSEREAEIKRRQKEVQDEYDKIKEEMDAAEKERKEQKDNMEAYDKKIRRIKIIGGLLLGAAAIAAGAYWYKKY